MDDRDIARWRVHTLRLAGSLYPSAGAVVDGLLAVQAEQFVPAAWAVDTRTSGATLADFHRMFDEGEILRTHVIRPTWHFARPNDLRWLLELTAPRIMPLFAQQRRRLGVDDAALERAGSVVAEALSGGVHLSRKAVGERLRDSGIPAQGQQLGAILGTLELGGLICSGALHGKDQTYALLDERAPDSRRLDRDEALAELVLRYFRGHGPATERDLAYWATLTLTDVRSGLKAVSDQLDCIEHGGRTYWFAQPPPATTDLNPRAHLLIIFDEYYRGYQDSRYVLDVDGLTPRGRTASIGMTLVDSQMVGDLSRTQRAGSVTFEVRLFRPLDDGEREAVEAAARRYGLFLGLEPAVVMSPF